VRPAARSGRAAGCAALQEGAAFEAPPGPAQGATQQGLPLPTRPRAKTRDCEIRQVNNSPISSPRDVPFPSAESAGWPLVQFCHPSCRLPRLSPEGCRLAHHHHHHHDLAICCCHRRSRCFQLDLCNDPAARASHTINTPASCRPALVANRKPPPAAHKGNLKFSTLATRLHRTFSAMVRGKSHHRPTE
jgi:hypothetical protein